MYNFIILPVVLYSSEASSLTLREGDASMLFANRTRSRIFGPEKMQ